MNLKKLYTAALIALLGAVTISCDDTTDTLGSDLMPATDLVTKASKAYDVVTQSYSAGDSVLARNSLAYLGQFTDPETGTVIKSDFMAQLYCSERFAFPDTVKDDLITDVKLRMFVSDYIGDTLATFKLSIYPLDKPLDPNKDYYTNIDPTEYYDAQAEPLAVKWFTLSDRSIDDDTRWDSDYNRNIYVTLPRQIGQDIYDYYRKSPEAFKSSDTWFQTGLIGSKGFYFKLECGDGAIAYIDAVQFNMFFRYHDQEYDADTTGVCQFAMTEEVVQSTRFENQNLDKLLSDTEATYVKSPAGIFTMATLPANQLNYNDTINSASISFIRYNDNNHSTFRLSIPKTLLMVRLDDYLDGYFEKYQVCDNRTSFLANFNANNNSYDFTNISQLLRVMMNEKQSGKATENYDKVLLIPVEATYDTKNTLVKVCHDFSMTSSRLVGGKNDRVKMNVIYSRYNK